MPNDFYGSGSGAPSSGTSYDTNEFEQREALKRSEYEQLRRHANYVGLCIIAFFALQYALVILLGFFDGSDEYLNNIAFSHAVNGIFFSVIALFGPFFVLSLHKGSPRYIGVLPFSASQNRLKALLVVLAGFGVCMFSNIVAGFVTDLVQSAGFEEADNSLPASVNLLEFVLNLLCTAALPAMVEEFVFRGVIMQPLRPYGDHFAVLSTAFIFGLAHGTVSTFVFAFLVGVVLGYAAVLTGSLWPGILIHFLNNFYAVVFTDLYSVNPQLADTLGNVIVVFGLIFGVGALVFLVLSRSLRFDKGSAKPLVQGKRFKGFFLSVPMLISIAIFLCFILIFNLE